jgi:tripartite-type tricarboxylate transporter receptor subunit TctC
MLMTSLAVVQPLMQTGRIKVLAVTSRQRAPSAPDVPTVAEAGYPALELDSPIGVFGPRGMPRGLRERVAEDIRTVVAADPTVSTRIGATGQFVDVRGPAEFAAAIGALRAKLAATAKILGIKSQ